MGAFEIGWLVIFVGVGVGGLLEVSLNYPEYGWYDKCESRWRDVVYIVPCLGLGVLAVILGLVFGNDIQH